MDNNTKVRIQERARMIAERAISILQDEDPDDTTALAAFKYGWLVLRGPKAFLERFGAGALEIERAEVVDFAWMLRHELPGGPEFTLAELEIIDEHNLEAAAYVQSSPRNSLMLVR
jgi:hypothetical protein